MASRRSRRGVLASVGTGLSVALAGCESLPVVGDGDGGDSISIGGTAGARAWPFHRGTAGNTGASASGGPSADATAAFTAGGTAYVTVTPNHVYYALGFLGALGILGPRASPEQVEKVRKQLYRGPNVVALHRDTGSVAWRTTLGSQARVFRPMVAGPDALYALYRDVDDPDEQTKVYALNRHDGSIRGSFGPVQPNRSFAVANGTLYTHNQGSVVAWR